MMVGNAIIEVVTRWVGRRTTLMLWAGSLFSLALVGVGVVDSFIPALALLSLSGVAIGVQSPVRQAFIHTIVPSEQRATVVSFDSMVTGGGMVIGQPGLGVLADRRGFSAGYVVGGLVTLLAIPILGLVRRNTDDADYFKA